MYDLLVIELPYHTENVERTHYHTSAHCTFTL